MKKIASAQNFNYVFFSSKMEELLLQILFFFKQIVKRVENFLTGQYWGGAANACMQDACVFFYLNILYIWVHMWHRDKLVVK